MAKTLKHSKYDEAPKDTDGGLIEHRAFPGEMRTFTPSDGESPGINSRLAEDSRSGDWSWKPHRDKWQGERMQTLGSSPFRFIERHPYGIEQAQGVPRATTKFTPEGKIAQYNVPPEKQGRQMRTGDQPNQIGEDNQVKMPSAMASVWSRINDRVNA